MSYNVAFVYTREAGAYEGVVTWTTFESKQGFDKWYTEDIRKREKVVEEGISEARCVDLVRQTPQACRTAVAFEEARDPESGEIDPKLLPYTLTNAMFGCGL